MLLPSETAHTLWSLYLPKYTMASSWILPARSQGLSLCSLSLGFSHVSALFDPMDCSPPGPLVHGIFQARILEWVAIFYSRGSSRPRDWNRVPLCLLHWQVDSLPLCHLRSPYIHFKIIIFPSPAITNKRNIDFYYLVVEKHQVWTRKISKYNLADKGWALSS